MILINYLSNNLSIYIELIDHLTESCEQMLSLDPNGKIIITGDINQLNIKDFISQHAFQLMVKAGTHGQQILDLFISNCRYLWNIPLVFQGVVRSDHLTVLVQTRISTKPTRKFVYFRDVTEHCKTKIEN